jgi:hypothetical protein
VRLGEDRISGCNPPDDWYTGTLWQPYAPGCTGDHFNGTLAGKRFEMFFGGVGRLETKFLCDIRSRGGIARLVNMLSHDVEYLLLALCKLFHRSCAL